MTAGPYLVAIRAAIFGPFYSFWGYVEGAGMNENPNALEGNAEPQKRVLSNLLQGPVPQRIKIP